MDDEENNMATCGKIARWKKEEMYADGTKHRTYVCDDHFWDVTEAILERSRQGIKPEEPRLKPITKEEKDKKVTCGLWAP